LDGARSGLWFEQVRLISELRPRVVILENVAELLGRGLGTVLGSLAEIGYNAEWECLPAAYVGARHIRDRIWIVAYPSGYRLERTLHLGDRLAAHVPNDWRATSRTPWPPDPEGWASESAFLGKDDDVSDWAQRIAALGNAVIPQIPELIGRAILQAVAA
jgi:DNA (cytosine-5)-methyltransferase 1